MHAPYHPFLARAIAAVRSVLGQAGLGQAGLGLMGVGALLIASGSATAGPALPQYAQDIHLGVASCASSTCHGSIQPWSDSRVLRNEFVTWTKQDKHSRAYQVLTNDRSKRIAGNLGIGDPTKAALCLDCHADNVPAGMRGQQFNELNDGVGCEACHGGAQRWLGIHISGISRHADSVAAGMYPTEEPQARARLCLSCHFGDQTKFVSHRLMGAGHPRMSFELDTFTQIQPAHFQIDKDYAERKTVATGVQTWAVGQAMALSKTLETLADPKRNHDGAFPELVVFDCQACHHPISNLRWQPRASTGLGPGMVRVNDANLVMLRVIARDLAPELAKALSARGRTLHQAVGQGLGQMAEAARSLKETVDELATSFAGHSFGPDEIRGLLDGVIRDGINGEYQDYAAAEQATMALASIMDTLLRAGLIDDARYKTMGAAIEKLYAAVYRDSDFQPRSFVNALKTFRDASAK